MSCQGVFPYLPCTWKDRWILLPQQNSWTDAPQCRPDILLSPHRSAPSLHTTLTADEIRCNQSSSPTHFTSTCSNNRSNPPSFPFLLRPLLRLHEVPKAVIGPPKCLGVAMKRSACLPRDGQWVERGGVNSDQATLIAGTEKLQH